MTCRRYAIFSTTIFLLIIVSTTARHARAGDGSGPRLIEEDFVANFESEPADIAADSFSLMLGNEQFEFTFSTEGDGYYGQGFSHSNSEGLSDSGSIHMQSALRDLFTMERIVIARDDGGLFIFSSIFINNGVQAWPVMVQGMRDGAPVGDAQEAPLNTAITLNFSNLLVDEVHLASNNFETTYMDALSGSTTAPMDYGDLPAVYGLTSEADDGARHAAGSVYLGNCLDTEADGQASVNADGDDTTAGAQTEGACALAGDDEDGLVPVTPWQNGVNGATLQATVTGGDSCLSGWIDWDGDGDFTDAGDHVLEMAPVSSGAQQVSFDVPAGVFAGSGPQNVFYGRFRLVALDSQSAGCGQLSALTVNGAAGSGEVEDYAWAFSSTAVHLSHFQANSGRTAGLMVPFLCFAGLLSLLTLRRARRK